MNDACNYPAKSTIVSKVLTFALCAISCCNGQSALSSPASVARAGDAIVFLRNAVTAMGSLGAWNSISKSHVTGILREESKDDRSFDWYDDWSGAHKLRRDFRNAKDGHKSRFVQQSPDVGPEQSVEAMSRTFKLPPSPRFDSISALAGHLPAAAISVALSQPAYSIRWYLGQFCPKNDHCIQLTNSSVHSGAIVKDVIFCFTGANVPPEKAIIFLPDMLHPGTRIPQEVTYDAYQVRDGLTLPIHITAQIRLVSKKNIDIGSTDFNPVFTTATFSEK